MEVFGGESVLYVNEEENMLLVLMGEPMNRKANVFAKYNDSFMNCGG